MLAAVAVLIAVVLVGCESTISGSAQPDPGQSAGTDTTESSTTTESSSGSIEFDANVGDCISLGGTTSNAKISTAACGSRSSNYKVIGKARTSAGCVSDRDNFYAETVDGIETGALCLDIDWVIGDCMDIGGDVPARIDCTAAAAEGVKVVEIAENTDGNTCSTTSGFEYPQRHRVVCVEKL